MVANMPFRVKWPVRLALLIPWALPLAFVGTIAAWFFQSEYGVVNDVLRHVRPTKIIWFNSGTLSFLATTVDFLDLGYGSALAVVMFVISMLVSVVYLKHIRGNQ
eukprot:gene1933-1962_t